MAKQTVMRRIGSVKDAVMMMRMQRILLDATHAIAGFTSVVQKKVLMIIFNASIASKNI